MIIEIVARVKGCQLHTGRSEEFKYKNRVLKLCKFERQPRAAAINKMFLPHYSHSIRVITESSIIKFQQPYSNLLLLLTDWIVRIEVKLIFIYELENELVLYY